MTDHAETMSRGSAVHDEQTGAATRHAAEQGVDDAGTMPDTIETANV